MDTLTVMKQALEALEKQTHGSADLWVAAVALRAAIEQSLGARVLDEREAYITWMTTTFPAVYDVERVEHCWENGHISRLAWEGRAMLATAPQPQPKQAPAPGWCPHCKQYSIEEPMTQREWVGLTDEEIEEAFYRNSYKEFAHILEAKLREKNGGRSVNADIADIIAGETCPGGKA